MTDSKAPRGETPEARTGVDPWKPAELPPPPRPKGLAWIGIVGPGVISLGASIGSGEFLLGPAAFVKYGLSLLWVTGVAAFLQMVFNTELMRYTLATGEPAFTGFMRTRPSSTFWGCVYVSSSTCSRTAGRDGRGRRRAPSSSCSPASSRVPRPRAPST